MAGELRGIIGPNGAGKTTLFNLITGNAPLVAGTVVLGGRAVAPKPAVMARGGVARTFQHPPDSRFAQHCRRRFAGRGIERSER